ncbi:uncharacterized protein LOC133409385 [Phycodurus eques]|uniref:uncharacterized protein LOC133409385 n=1 Tax=Phycodurus eques TaxID=693459 RepID=UPI002ACE6BFA|nr:uncharacterized protein LOC133409385 [Phycodurus eques]
MTMSEDKRPIRSMISPVKAKLQKNFEASDKDTAVIRAMKQAFTNDLEKRYAGLDDLFYTAAALDPRFQALPFLRGNDAERTFTSISAEATSLNEKATGHPAEKGPVQTDSCQTHPAHEDQDITTDRPQTHEIPTANNLPCKKKKTSALDQPFGDDFEARSTAARSLIDQARDEVRRYRDCETLPLKSNPLQWRKEQQDLPLLPSLAKQYLCMPATSVASERVF